ncbi:MAG TPA: FAD:protein FMN transferase [Acidimicrobiales bacterium]|nr:FAD:protein FMN transferase [Acidimicrobiales bacterium]
MGTVVSFDVRGDDADGLRRGLQDACALLHRADEVFSTWKPDSPMNRLRRNEISLAEAPPEVTEVLERCRRARRLSAGWFDPWALPGGVDPTGLVKGWAAQRAALALERTGTTAAMVNAGGDVAVLGRPAPGRPWRIGIRDPRHPERMVAVAALTDGFAALATSGTYERGNHVLDPFTGEPAATLLSASVVGADLADADALATGLLAAGTDGLAVVAGLEGYEALVVETDLSLKATEGFPLG